MSATGVVAYAASFVAGGTPVAEGCSGGGSVSSGGSTGMPSPAVKYLAPILPQMPVDRDGFFPFWADTYGLTAEQAIDALVIEVTDAAGESVPGSLQLLRQMESAGDREFTLGWQANDKLEAGQILSVVGTATGASEDVRLTATLSVKDASAELVMPPLAFSDWTAVTRDIGSENTCPQFCGNATFGDAFEQVQRAEFAAQFPQPQVMAYWEYNFVAVHSKGDLLAPKQFFFYNDGNETFSLGDLLFFGDAPDEYCVLVTARDLRLGRVESKTVCATPERPLTPERADRIKACSSLPASEEHAQRWCVDRDLASYPMCAPYVGDGGAPPPASGGSNSAGGSGGSGGSSGGTATGGAGSGSGGTGTTNPEPPPAAGSGATPNDGEGGESTDAGGRDKVVTEGGCGCRVAPSGGGREGWFALIGFSAFGLGWIRRRVIR